VTKVPWGGVLRPRTLEREKNKQVVKAIWQEGRIAAAHGRYNGIRQVAPLCTPFKTCFLKSTRVHNPNGILIGSAIFAQFMAECRRASPKFAPSRGAIWTPSDRCSLGPNGVLNGNGISVGSAVFVQLTAERPYTLQWAALFPSNCPFPAGDLDPYLIPKQV